MGFFADEFEITDDVTSTNDPNTIRQPMNDEER